MSLDGDGNFIAKWRGGNYRT